MIQAYSYNSAQLTSQVRKALLNILLDDSGDQISELPNPPNARPRVVSPVDLRYLASNFWVTLQCGVGEKESVMHNNILPCHSYTSSVAELKYIRNTVLVHEMLVWKHLAADERVYEVSLGPGIGQFPADVDVGVDRVDDWHFEGCGSNSAAESNEGLCHIDDLVVLICTGDRLAERIYLGKLVIERLRKKLAVA